MEYVNEPQTEAELKAIRHCVNRGTPYGNENWARGQICVGKSGTQHFVYPVLNVVGGFGAYHFGGLAGADFLRCVVG